MLGVVVYFDQKCYRIVSDNLKSSCLLSSLSSEAMLLMLECINKLPSKATMVQMFKNKKCLKTVLGYKCPYECFLVSPESNWGCLLRVFGSVPIIDETFYGSSIFSMAKELKKLGVKVDFDDAAKEFTRTFKQHALASSFRKENVFLFLECYRKLKKMMVHFPEELIKCIRDQKWLRTKLGDYRSPNGCILFSTEWEPISSICVLPFIDDSDNFYGSEIRDYQVELKQLGVVTRFNEGSKFVAAGLLMPICSSNITPANIYALLNCVKVVPDKFLEKLSHKNWLKTHFGYKCPHECLLFSHEWATFLKHDDGPFIDEQFYGSRIKSYKKELNILGVICDVKKGCRVMLSYLHSQSNFERIKRCYNFLSELKPDLKDDLNNKKIWIPRGTDNGKWVTPQDCVLYDKHNLFGDQFYVLETFKYDKKILGLFADIYNVKVHPSVDDHCNLWKKWEMLRPQITHTECCAFWECVVKNWYSVTEKTFNKSISKLPVTSPNSDGIFLLKKRDVFIGDDLFLMDLFQCCSSPIFVWYPSQSSSKSLTRTKLVDIYEKLGVRTLSQSVQKTLHDVDHVKFKPVSSKEKIIKKGLIKLILGFLADPNLNLGPVTRHKAVNRIMGIQAFETVEPMAVRYSLSLSCGDVVKVEAKRRIRWDKQNSRMFMQKMGVDRGHKNVLEYASDFAEVIAEGMLWENEELVPQLSELIKFGYLLEFDEEAVELLMKMKNLQLFMEDHDYLSSVLSC